MQRIPEPELMDSLEQARAYAQADFEQPHERFVLGFKQCFPEFPNEGRVLDLGCGPADISIRFARHFDQVNILGLDAGPNMLSLGREAVLRNDLAERIYLNQAYLPMDSNGSLCDFEVIICNSLLHHLADPMVLWQSIKQFAKDGAYVYVMDLFRPDSEADARVLTQEYAGGEPQVLQQDFYNSLLASYRVEEVQAQLAAAELNYLQVDTISDRHMLISGRYQA